MGAQLQGYGHRVPEQGPASGSRGESSSELDKQGWETASCLGLTALMEEEPSSAGCGAAPRCPGAAGPFLPPPQTQLSARCCCSLPLCPAAGSPWQPLSAGLSEGVITLSAEHGPPAPPAARAAPREAGIDSAALDGLPHTSLGTSRNQSLLPEGEGTLLSARRRSPPATPDGAHGDPKPFCRGRLCGHWTFAGLQVPGLGQRVGSGERPQPCAGAGGGGAPPLRLAYLPKGYGLA